VQAEVEKKVLRAGKQNKNIQCATKYIEPRLTSERACTRPFSRASVLISSTASACFDTNTALMMEKRFTWSESCDSMRTNMQHMHATAAAIDTT
jgi:hypothetical protein